MLKMQARTKGDVGFVADLYRTKILVVTCVVILQDILILSRFDSTGETYTGGCRYVLLFR